MFKLKIAHGSVTHVAFLLAQRLKDSRNTISVLTNRAFIFFCCCCFYMYLVKYLTILNYHQNHHHIRRRRRRCRGLHHRPPFNYCYTCIYFLKIIMYSLVEFACKHLCILSPILVLELFTLSTVVSLLFLLFMNTFYG